MADEPTREELAAEVETLRAERAINLATANKARLDALDQKTAMGLERNRQVSESGLDANRRQSDERLEERSDRDRAVAVELAEHGAARDRESAIRREDAASKLAYERGADAARMAARFDKIEDHARMVNGSIDRTAKALERLDETIEQMVLDQAKRDAATLALAAELANRNATTVTFRQFAFGLAGLVLSMGGLLIAVSGH